MSKITAPWTIEQARALNKWQRLGYVHEFTCPRDHEDRALVASTVGWLCPHCDYMQDWAHDFMCDEAKHPKHPFAGLEHNVTGDENGRSGS